MPRPPCFTPLDTRGIARINIDNTKYMGFFKLLVKAANSAAIRNKKSPDDESDRG